MRLDACPKCGTPTTPQRGHPSLCLPCTEAEIGMTVTELRNRVSSTLLRGKSRKWSMHEDTGARRRENR